jgi:hypothetical protein
LAAVAGVDPRPWSLRDLATMAEARERVEWGRCVGVALMVGGLFSQQDPWKIVPERLRPEKPKPRAMSPEERAARMEIALGALGAMFGQQSE